jgi:hypothetical protein
VGFEVPLPLSPKRKKRKKKKKKKIKKKRKSIKGLLGSFVVEAMLNGAHKQRHKQPL